MTGWIDQACDAAPLYLLGGSICVLALLLAILIAVIAWPMNSRVRVTRGSDVVAQHFGDQPRWRP